MSEAVSPEQLSLHTLRNSLFAAFTARRLDNTLARGICFIVNNEGESYQYLPHYFHVFLEQNAIFFHELKAPVYTVLSVLLVSYVVFDAKYYPHIIIVYLVHIALALRKDSLSDSVCWWLRFGRVSGWQGHSIICGEDHKYSCQAHFVLCLHACVETKAVTFPTHLVEDQGKGFKFQG